MTIATAPAVVPKASMLSDKDRQEGVKILMSLQTVEDALRVDDAISVHGIAVQVVKEEQGHKQFSAFIRRVGTFEYPTQTKVVEDLLLDCFGGISS